MAADAETLAELNVEARILLACQVREAVLERLLPAGWKATPAESGPSQGANLNVILADRQLVQDAGGKPVSGHATNHLVVIAVPAQHPEMGARGVMIVVGLSARPEGAPGPYGVFLPAAANVNRILSSGPGETREAKEEWSFASGDGERLSLRLRYTRGVPTRSETQTRAYSVKDPTFYRIYRADQGADVLRSAAAGKDAISELDFSADGPRLGALFDGSERLVGVISIPWTVRRAFLPFHAAVLHLQNLDPAAYTKPYRIREQTLWIDSPTRTRENGLLLRGQKVWLDQDLPEGARGMCKAKLEKDTTRYVLEVENLQAIGES